MFPISHRLDGDNTRVHLFLNKGIKFRVVPGGVIRSVAQIVVGIN